VTSAGTLDRTSSSTSACPFIAAFHAAYLVDAAIAVCGFVCAITLIRTRDARVTMQRA